MQMQILHQFNVNLICINYQKNLKGVTILLTIQ